MEEKQCYSITTYRLHLCCRHPEWLSRTQELYNQIEHFYYDLLLENPQLRDMGSQKTLRELEILSIPGRDGRIPVSPLPWEKIPLYFRRSAANAGIAAAKSHFTRSETAPGRTAQSLNSAVVYYKGMYRDFSSSEITLKVYDGEKWNWMRCRLYGKALPDLGQIMSPSVVFEYKYIMLHVPVKEFQIMVHICTAGNSCFLYTIEHCTGSCSVNSIAEQPVASADCKRFYMALRISIVAGNISIFKETAQGFFLFPGIGHSIFQFFTHFRCLNVKSVDKRKEGIYFGTDFRVPADGSLFYGNFL